MTTTVLRIFSYLPNPRVWKSVFAARLGGLEVEITGDKPGELGEWLWDVHPRRLEAHEKNPTGPLARQSRRGFGGVLYKTDAFLEAHPFGTVPAAFGPDGTGVFESNSILRSVGRMVKDPPLYGRGPYEASRIDSFLDANLVFAREAQVYLLGLGGTDDITHDHGRMAAAFEFYVAGIEAALALGPYLVGNTITLADISFACDFAQFLREGHYTRRLEQAGLSLISADGADRYPRCFAHLAALSAREEFAELQRYLRWYYEQ